MSDRGTMMHVVNGLGVGGAEKVLMSLIAVSREFEHVVIVLGDDLSLKTEIEDVGGRVFSFGLKTGFGSLLAIFKLREKIILFEPFGLNAWMYHSHFIAVTAALVSRQKRLRTFCLIHNGALVGGSMSYLGFFASLLSSWLPKNTFISSSFAALHLHKRAGFRVSKNAIVTNGYQTEKFRFSQVVRNKLRDQLGLHDKYVFCCVGRFSTVKNQICLLKAINELRELGDSYKVLFVGSDTEPGGQLYDSALALGVDTERFQGFGIIDNVSDLMAASDCLLLSSLGESFPNVVCEAMSSGLEIVCSNVGDVSLITRGRATLLKEASSKSFAGAMITHIETRPNFNKRNTELIDIANKYLTVDQMYDNLSQFWMQPYIR